MFHLENYKSQKALRVTQSLDARHNLSTPDVPECGSSRCAPRPGTAYRSTTKTAGPRAVMILQQPLERGPPGRDPRATTGVTLGLDTREPLHKHFLSEENMATHFSRLSLHNDHPYCSPPVTFPEALPPLRSPCPELLLWRYPGSLIPEALRLLRLGDNPSPYYSASPAGEIMEL